MQLPLVMLTLVLVLALSSWTILTVVAVKVASLTAYGAPISAVTMHGHAEDAGVRCQGAAVIFSIRDLLHESDITGIFIFIWQRD